MKFFFFFWLCRIPAIIHKNLLNFVLERNDDKRGAEPISWDGLWQIVKTKEKLLLFFFLNECDYLTLKGVYYLLLPREKVVWQPVFVSKVTQKVKKGCWWHLIMDKMITFWWFFGFIFKNKFQGAFGEAQYVTLSRRATRQQTSFILACHHKAEDYIITPSLKRPGLLFSILIYDSFWNAICSLFVDLNSYPDLFALGQAINSRFLCPVRSAQMFPMVKIYL